MSVFNFKTLVPACLLWAAFTNTAQAGCSGDLVGTWERRPAFTTDAFQPVEEFRLDSRTGFLEDCTREISYDARLIRMGRSLTFLYRARAQTLHPVSPGVYLSKQQTLSHDGTRWEYRYRLIDRRG